MSISAALSGGSGDVILNSGLLKRLEEYYGTIDVYTDHPETFEFFHGRPQSGRVIDILETKSHENILINSFGTVCNGMVRLGDYFRYFTPERNGILKPLIDANEEFFNEHPKAKYFVDRHPLRDGHAADYYSDLGFKRHTLPQQMLGHKDVPFISMKPDPLPFLNMGKYITIHQGIGLNHQGMGVKRATKVWDTVYYEDLIHLIKSVFPGIFIVQIGTPTGDRFKGVDFTFTGPITDAYKVIAHSRLHIDGDSGHVHAAKAFGVKSVVIFGPTPIKWFGYEENINLSLELECQPCFWATDTWLKTCPAGYKAPHCMTLLFPNKVFEYVKKELSEGGLSRTGIS